MSGIDAPENRPALAWVLRLPRHWATSNQRLVLLALALDSYDGRTCSPGRDAILSATGLWASSYYDAVEALEASTEHRPALLKVTSRRGARTVYELLNGLEPSRGIPTHSQTGSESGNPDSLDHANPVGESRLTPATEVSRGSKSGKGVGEVSRGSKSGNPDSTTPLHPDPEGGMDEDESAHAPAPGSAALTRLEASVFDALAERWSDDQPVVSRRSRRLLGDLLNAGWPEAAIRAGVATIGKSPRNPSLLLEKHLRRLLDEHEPRDFGNLDSGDARALADSDPAAMVQAAPEVADPLAEVDQRALAKWCKYAGADVKALRQACADLTRQGFTIEANLHGGNLADYPALDVIHPYDTDEFWCVSWQVGREPGEPPCNSLYAGRNDGEGIEGEPSVAGLRRLVAQTWPEAKAAIDEYRASTATEPTAQREGVSE